MFFIHDYRRGEKTLSRFQKYVSLDRAEYVNFEAKAKISKKKII